MSSQQTTTGSFADLFIQRQQQKLAERVLSQFDEVNMDTINELDANHDGKYMSSFASFSPYNTS